MRQTKERSKSEFRAETHPGYVEFADAVRAVARDQIKTYKLIGLYFKSHTFTQHWNSTGPEVPERLAWNSIMFGLGAKGRGPTKTFDPTDIRCIIVAWMRRHGRYPNDNELAEIDKMILRKHQEAKPTLDQQRKHRNEKKKQRRTRMKGRPKQTTLTCLRHRILTTLAEGRSTPSILSNTLGENKNAVTSQLRRMAIEGVITKLGYGLYDLTTPVIATPEPTLTAPEPLDSNQNDVVLEAPMTRQEREEYLKEAVPHTDTSKRLMTAETYEEAIAATASHLLDLHLTDDKDIRMLSVTQYSKLSPEQKKTFSLGQFTDAVRMRTRQ